MADLVRTAAKATSSLLDIKGITVDNWTFKLFYRVTTSLLIGCSVLVGARQLFGGPISCDAGAAQSSVSDDVLRSYCWMYAQFKIPPEYKGPCSSAGLNFNEQEAPIYNSYYQWVSLYLFFIGMLFFAPRGLWLLMEGGLMKHLCKGASSRLVEEYDEKIDRLMRYFSRNTPNRFRVYYSGFIFCQFLNLVVVAIVVILTHFFLHQRFIGYGFNVWHYYQFPPEEQQTIPNPMCYTFPRITTCDYYRYGTGGGQTKISALCILSLNIVNDKVFLVLWWWFLLLVVVAILELIFFGVQICSVRVRYQMVRMRLYRYFKRNDKMESVKVYVNQLGSGDWFVLHQMSKNMNRPFFAEFLLRLSQANAASRSLGAGLDQVDLGGGSIVDLMLQPYLEDGQDGPKMAKHDDDSEDEDAS